MLRSNDSRSNDSWEHAMNHNVLVLSLMTACLVNVVCLYGHL